LNLGAVELPDVATDLKWALVMGFVYFAAGSFPTAIQQIRLPLTFLGALFLCDILGLVWRPN